MELNPEIVPNIESNYQNTTVLVHEIEANAPATVHETEANDEYKFIKLVHETEADDASQFRMLSLALLSALISFSAIFVSNVNFTNNCQYVAVYLLVVAIFYKLHCL